MESLSEGCGAATLRRHVTGCRCLPEPPYRPPLSISELERFAKGGSDKLFSLIRLKEFPLGANGVYLSQLSRPGQKPVNPLRAGGRDGKEGKHVTRGRGRAPHLRHILPQKKGEGKTTIHLQLHHFVYLCAGAFGANRRERLSRPPCTGVAPTAP